MSITYIAASAKPTLELGGKIWTSDPFDSVDGLAGAQGMNDGLNTGIGPWMNMTGSDSGINDADGEMIIGMILGVIGFAVLMSIVISLVAFRKISGSYNVFKPSTWRKRRGIATQYNTEPISFAENGLGGPDEGMSKLEKEQKETEKLMAGASLAQAVFREPIDDATLPEYGGGLTMPPSYHRRESLRHSGGGLAQPGKRLSGNGWLRADDEKKRDAGSAEPLAYVVGEDPVSPKSVPAPAPTRFVV